MINTNYESSPKSLCSIKDKLLFNSFSYDVISINKQDLLESKVNFAFNKYIDSLKKINSIHVNKNDEIMILYKSNKYKVDDEGIFISKDINYVFKNAGNIYNVFIDNNEFVSFRYYRLNDEIGNYNKIGYDIFDIKQLNFFQISTTKKFVTELGSFKDVNNYYLNEYLRINDSIMMVVGPHKSIFVSYNNGINWDVISTKKSPSKSFFLSKDKEYHFTGKCDVISSINKGHTYFINEYDSIINKTLNKYGIENTNLNSIHLDSLGKLVAVYPYHSGFDQYSYILRSWDFGKTFKYDPFTKINIEYNQVYSTPQKLFKNDTNYYITQFINYGWNKTLKIFDVYSSIYTLDSNLENVSLKKMKTGKLNLLISIQR